MIFSATKVRFSTCVQASGDGYLCRVSRIIAIDFGLKRTGLAITDPLGLIANGLDTVESRLLMDRLKSIQSQTPFDVIVVGQPKRMNGQASDIEQNILWFIEALEKEFPNHRIERMDERFTSKLATQAMLQSGIGKKRRAEKGLVDKVSATILLQDYLNLAR